MEFFFSLGINNCLKWSIQPSTNTWKGLQKYVIKYVHRNSVTELNRSTLDMLYILMDRDWCYHFTFVRTHFQRGVTGPVKDMSQGCLEISGESWFRASHTFDCKRRARVTSKLKNNWSVHGNNLQKLFNGPHIIVNSS